MQSTILNKTKQPTSWRQNLVKSSTLLYHNRRSLNVRSSDAAIALTSVAESGAGLFELTKDNFW
jgi:hypothetical protein